MNVNDLADRLEQFYTGTHIDKAAETLRQQAQEIENLRKELALQKLSDIGQEIENEPSVQKSEMSTLHELTDKEIDDLIFEHNCIDDYCHKFVRACIKKASNK